MDPNEKTGPAGFGPSRFIAADSPLSYRVGFENEADATAPAHRVIVTDRLDANLDWDTLAWTAAGFGDVVLSIPDGTRHYQTTVPITQNGHTFQVEIELDLDPQTGVVTAVFDSVDPVTGLPPDALTGFLPPEDESGRGQGFLSYVVRPKPGLPTGTTLRNIARIVFDGNDPIDTNQIDPHDPTQGTDPEKEAFNTLDAGDPTSSVAGLPATTPTTAFTVNWLGQDDQSGSGVGTYTIYVSDNGSPYAPWLVRVPSTSAEYTGVNGHTYAFYSVAADNVGHLEDAPASPDATTHIAVPVSVVSMTINGNSSTLAGSQRSLVKSIAYVFNQAVSLADGAFSIAVHAGSTGTLPTLIWTSPDGGTTWVVTFSGSGVVAGSIADGRYDITLHAGAVSTAPGGTLAADRTDAFFRLYGDITGNGQVDFADFFQFRAALGSQSGDSNFKAAFDYNGDGRVDFVDFFQFRTRLGTTI